jgi:hypothetical protein
MVTKVLTYGRMVENLPFSGNLSIDADTTTGLTLGYTAGYIVNKSTRTAVSAGTVALTDDATNWIYEDKTVVLVNAGAAPTLATILYKVITASGIITSITDYRGATVTDKVSFT